MTPEFAKEFAQNCHDPVWRLSSGMYWIKVKDTVENPSGMMPFKHNRTQRRFLKNIHYRNIILKARQLGFTTLTCLLWLDYALHNDNVNCGIVAQSDPAAVAFFRDKVKFAYEKLDPELQALYPLKTDSSNELVFAHNGSSIRVATSFASATLHRLLVSEYGKICAQYPEKANEVVIGTIPTVPENGIIIIESTGEGAEGDFHDRVVQAEKNAQLGKELTIKDYRLHFYPWFIDPTYAMNPNGVEITAEDHEYFDRIEKEMDVEINIMQRAWYVSTRKNSFNGDEIKMYSQYPSTSSEPFFVSNEGNYYSKEMASVRKGKRICRIPRLDLPVNTFWDVGNSDGCAIWFHQKVGLEHRFIGYYEAHGETLAHYYKELQKKDYIWNKHFLPHDADHKRLSDSNKSIKEMLEDLGLTNIEIVPKITDLNTGIQITKKHFPEAFFDEVECIEGIARLDGYKKKYNSRDERWVDEPNKANGCSEAADAFRQWAQAEENGDVVIGGNTPLVNQGYFTQEQPDWRL